MTLAATLVGPSIFDGADLNVSLMAGALNLLDFSNVSPSDLASMLGQISDMFIALARSQAMNVEIPFTGKTVGEVIDFATAYKEEILDPLFVSGDILRPDNDGNGTVDLNFDSIQQLVASLGLGNAVYDPLTGDLTFSLNHVSALGLGEVLVQTVFPGGSSGNERQRLTINGIATPSNPAIGDTYKLGFPDANGSLQFTSTIAFNAMAATIKTRLEALSGIGTGNVLVNAGRVDTTTPGDGSHNEVQQIRLFNPMGGTFRLSFDNGATWTGNLDYDDDADSILSALEGLAGITDVSVVKSSNGDDTIFTVTFLNPGNTNVNQLRIDGDLLATNVFEVEFLGALAGTNVAQLRGDASDLAGVYSLDFGETLGGLVNLETSGKLTFDASFTSNLTFGVNLAPSQAIQLTPPVFDSGAKISVDTTNQGGGGTNEIQTVTLTNVTGGQFQLSYGTSGTTVTDPINFDTDPTSGADSVRAKLEALTAINPGDVTVTKPTDTSSKIVYQITFNNTAATNVAEIVAVSTLLQGAGENGKITADAHFDVALFNDPVVFVNTDTQGGQGEFILTRKLNHIDSLQIVLDICLPMRYKGNSTYISFEGNCLEPLGNPCPSRSSIRRAAIPATHAATSLPGLLA